MSETLITVNNLSRVFGRGDSEVTALEDISLTVSAGEFVSLMGPSGSGKSTLLNILAGIDHQTSGEVTVLGEDLSRLSEDQLAGWRNDHVGFIFQHFNLIPVLTAFENVELPLLLTRLSREERRRQVETALGVVNLADRMSHRPNQLSGGQEQRVAIARAIVTDPTFLLADEPTGDLDAESAAEILDVMTALNRDFGKTIVMVTHDPRAASRATINYFLDKGLMVSNLETGVSVG